MKIELDLEKDDEFELRDIAHMILRKYPEERDIPFLEREDCIVLGMIRYLESAEGKNIVIDNLIRECKKMKLPTKKTEKCIDNLERAGEIFEIKEGFIQVI